MTVQTSTYQNIINKSSEWVLEAGISGAVGYICSYAFSIINPIHGAVYCMVSTVVSKMVQPLFQMMFNQEGASSASKLVSRVFSIIVSAAASAFIATLCGFPITLATGLVLSGIIFAAHLATLAFIGVIGFSAATAITASTR